MATHWLRSQRSLGVVYGGIVRAWNGAGPRWTSGRTLGGRSLGHEELEAGVSIRTSATSSKSMHDVVSALRYTSRSLHAFIHFPTALALNVWNCPFKFISCLLPSTNTATHSSEGPAPVFNPRSYPPTLTRVLSEPSPQSFILLPQPPIFLPELLQFPSQIALHHRLHILLYTNNHGGNPSVRPRTRIRKTGCDIRVG